MLRKIIKLLLIVVWMGIIFSFSNDTGEVSTRKSDGVIIRTVEVFLDRDLSDAEKEKLTEHFIVPVRKGAHLFIYLVLGVLLVSFCGEFGEINWKLVLLSVFLVLIYACSDELHQFFVPGRSGQLSDVVLDTMGAFIGIMGYKLIHNKVRRRCL